MSLYVCINGSLQGDLQLAFTTNGKIIINITTVLLSAGWVPETSWSCRYCQPAPKWRLHPWLAKPNKPAMSPHACEKTGTRHTDKQWRVEGGREGKNH